MSSYVAYWERLYLDIIDLMPTNQAILQEGFDQL
jgi:hypothetical protein